MLYRNTLLRSAVLLVLCSLCLYGRTTKPYFRTPNDLFRMPATVTLTDGTVRTGLLTILLENEYLAKPLISLQPADNAKEDTLQFSGIRMYRLNGNTYAAKMVNLYSNGTLRGLFLKQLLPDSSRIQLCQLEQHFKSNAEGEDRDYYYIAAPAFSATVIELQSALLVPSFETKMAAYVENCPALAGKIANKTRGYSYSFMTATFRKLEIMKRIIEEYNQCH